MSTCALQKYLHVGELLEIERRPVADSTLPPTKGTDYERGVILCPERMADLHISADITGGRI